MSSLLVPKESRTVCCRNVQLMPTNISETYEDMTMGKRQIRRFQRPTQV